MDAQKTPFMTEFASCWGLLMGSLVIATPVIFFKVKESTDVEEDLRFSDETTAEVLGDMEEAPEKPHAEQQDTSSKA